ncbi:TPA: LLM class flavin-dependent oxidoreductase [Candidatus Bathyarchaeota archaeon]|nr:LLM class flavin-dependent oxidoreductase [Candidatus Bathyarchaeota archaeon]
MSIRFGCQLVTYGDVAKTLEYARISEKAGFDVISLPDHLFHPLDKRFLKEPPWDAYVVLGAIGSTVKRVKLMPAVSDALRRHPATIAHSIATLDRLTGGRAVLGLGAGEAFNLNPLEDVAWDKPVTILEEAVKVVKLLWGSSKDKPAYFEGKYFKLKGAHLSLKPLQKPEPPIYLGGYGRKMKRLVAELGCGWLPWLETPETYERGLAEIRGMGGSRVPPAVMVPTCISRDGERAERIAAPRIKVALCLRRRLLKELGYNRLADGSTDLWRASLSDEELSRMYGLAEDVPEKLVKEVAILGEPREAVAAVERYVKAGVELLIVIPSIQNFEETIEAYERAIIPCFK